jgi:hypothetical protein
MMLIMGLTDKAKPVVRRGREALINNRGTWKKAARFFAY